jgi:hypothetical protein
MSRIRGATCTSAAAWGEAKALLRPRSSLPLLEGCTNGQESAEALNVFYIEKVEKLRASMPSTMSSGSCSPSSRQSSSDLLQPAGGKEPFEIHCVGQDTIRRHIKGLRDTTAIGHDGVPVSVWKKTPSLVIPVMHLVNASIRRGEVPAAFKHAIIHPVLKKGKQAKDRASYRPVAVLPALSKVLEAVVASQLSHYLEYHGLLPPEQHGFRRGRSTLTAIATSTATWAKAHAEANVLGLLAFDFSAAFDTVAPSKVNCSLEEMVATSKMLCWISSYMHGGSQAVEWNGHRSRTLSVSYGVRQGSILGPLLFIICSSSIPSSMVKAGKEHAAAHALVYADDSNAMAHSSDPQKVTLALNEMAAAISDRASELELALNPTKTQLLLAGPLRATAQASERPVAIRGEQLIPKDDIEVLGFVFDKHLSPQPYLDRLLASLRSVLGVARRLQPLLPPHVHGEVVRAIANGKVATYAAAATHVRLNGAASVGSTEAKIQVTLNNDAIRTRDLLDRSGLRSLNEAAASSSAALIWAASNMPSHPLHQEVVNRRCTGVTRAASNDLVVPLSPAERKVGIALSNGILMWNSYAALRAAKSVTAAKSCAKEIVRSIPV